MDLTKNSLFFFLLMLPITLQAANGPSVNELRDSLNSTWNTLLRKTNCDIPPPQDSICMQKHNGKTITIKLFGQPINMLILFETSTTSNVSGPVYTQQTGFLIGPIDGYGYKIVNELQTQGLYQNRSIVNNGLKVFAHPITGQNISSQGIELNKGKNWLNGKHGPWWAHWTALPKIEDSLEELKNYLNLNY